MTTTFFPTSSGSQRRSCCSAAWALIGRFSNGRCRISDEIVLQLRRARGDARTFRAPSELGLSACSLPRSDCAAGTRPAVRRIPQRSDQIVQRLLGGRRKIEHHAIIAVVADDCVRALRMLATLSISTSCSPIKARERAVGARGFDRQQALRTPAEALDRRRAWPGSRPAPPVCRNSHRRRWKGRGGSAHRRK